MNELMSIAKSTYHHPYLTLHYHFIALSNSVFHRLIEYESWSVD